MSIIKYGKELRRASIARPSKKLPTCRRYLAAHGVRTSEIGGNVADARKRVLSEGYDYGCVFIVDDENRIRGSISLTQILFQAEDGISLSALVQDVGGAIRASATLERALEAKEWSETDLLPVADRDDRFIGVLRYAELSARRCSSARSGEGVNDAKHLFTDGQ